MTASTLSGGLIGLLDRVGVDVDEDQAAALCAGLVQLLGLAAAPAAEATCCICGCPMSDLNCGHSCCCMAGPGRGAR